MQRQIQQYGRPGEAVIPKWLDAEHLYGILWLTTPKMRMWFVPISESLWDRLWTCIRRLHVGSRELVFTNQLGHPVREATERHHWLKALEAVGLPRVKVHSARHWMASMAAMAGMPDDARTSVMEHVNVQMTARYKHRDTASLRRLMTAAIPDLHEDHETIDA